MNKTNAKHIIKHQLKSFFKDFDFRMVNKLGLGSINFLHETPEESELCTVHTLFGPLETVYIEYSILKGFTILNKIGEPLINKFPLAKDIFHSEKGWLYNFNPGTLSQNRHLFWHQPKYEMKNEEDVERVVGELKEFFVQTAYPILNRNTLSYLDKAINGEEFWPMLYENNDKVINLISGFDFKRIIMAKLCKNSRYNELTIFIKQRWIEMYNKHLISSEEFNELNECFNELMLVLDDY